MNIRLWLTSMAFAACTTPASADFLSGNELYEECRNRSSMCSGYIIGLTDMLTYLHGNYTCIPRQVNVGQIADIYVRYAQNHADERHLSAARVFRGAMVNAFPC